MFAPKNWWWVSKPILVIDLGPCPTLGWSISFPCSQLQCAAQEVTMSISAFLRPSVCSLIFTLEHSKQDVPPVFHQCLISVSPVSHQFLTIISQVFHQCFISVSPMFHQCLAVSPVSHHCFTSVVPLFQECLTTVSPVFYQYFTSVSQVLFH